ncbi:MAG: hypothetical protein RLZ55_1166 [Actinomycetota bacterium]|jgi:regulator of protease activity HflC (stomatin/prohibitin superfamily)
MTALVSALVTLVVIVFAIFIAMRTFILVRQAQTAIVERLGKYHSTLSPGLHFIVPIIDKVVARIDMREQVVVFQPQSVITRDNLVVSIDSVVYFQVADAERSTYEIQDYLTAIEQMSITTLRNIIGALDLEQTLTSRDAINAALRTALDETTGSWGVRISRVELRSITPPANVQQAMEAQMRAEREKRAAILTAEGQQQSAIKVAEGEKQSAILKAEGDRQAAILRAQGESEALANVVATIHDAGVDDKVLAYQQIQQWRYIAAYPSNKLWLLPQELSQAAAAMSRAFGAPEGTRGGASGGSVQE